MGEISHRAVVHLEVDGDRRTAQFGMGGGGRIGFFEAAEARDIAGQIEDSLVIDVVQHRFGPGRSGGGR